MFFHWGLTHKGECHTGHHKYADKLFSSLPHWVVLLSSYMEGAELGGKFVLWNYIRPFFQFWDLKNFSGWLERKYPDITLEIDTHIYIWPCSWCHGYIEGKSHFIACPILLLFLLFFHFGFIADWCSLAFIVLLCVNNNAVCHCALQFTKCFHQRYVIKMLWKLLVLCRCM